MTYSLAHFNALNDRMAVLINEKISAVIGTDEERPLMRIITQQGIDAAKLTIEMLRTGFTYEMWKNYLVTINAPDGLLSRFENDQGDMAKLLQEFVDNDFEEVFQTLLADGSITEELVQQDLDQLTLRMEWIEKNWGKAE